MREPNSMFTFYPWTHWPIFTKCGFRH